MRQRFTEWYAKTYGFNDGPWWVELLAIFLFSPSVYYVEMHKEITEMGTKGGVDESILSRIFAPVPDDSNVSDKSGAKSE